MSDPKLNILRRSHEALLAYEKNRAARRPRTPDERAAVLKVLRAHRKTFLAAGGKDQDFILDSMIREMDPQTAPKPASAEGNGKTAKGKDRKGAKS